MQILGGRGTTKGESPEVGAYLAGSRNKKKKKKQTGVQYSWNGARSERLPGAGLRRVFRVTVKTEFEPE